MTVSIQKIRANPFLVGVACALLATLGLSLKAIFIKLIYQLDANVDALSILVIRMALSMPLFYVLVKRYAPAGKCFSIQRGDMVGLVVLGIAGFYLSAILDFSALAYIPASLERLVLFLYPTFVVLLTLFIRPQEIRFKTVVALLFSYLGIVVVFYEQAPLIDAEYTKGVILVFAAAVVFAAYTVRSVKHIETYGALRFTVYAMLGASVATVIHALLAHGMGVFLQPLTVYLLIVPMVLFSTVLPLILMAEGIRRIGASNASIISTSGPVLTLSLAYLLLGENLGLLQVLGGIMILVGVFMVARK